MNFKNINRDIADPSYIERNLLSVSKELSIQKDLAESIPDGMRPLSDCIADYTDFIDHGEYLVALECIIALINNNMSKLRGKSVVSLMVISSIYGDRVKCCDFI
ncbi:hypothetical protein [Asaia sp. VD9]|uniref:hypothetical protein n=1 Tax=Asaia sp. VD9 TaxID=3081235 RepID=UPI00301A2456